jgi:signal transduction histidine kinase/HAMP domain-containing protein
MRLRTKIVLAITGMVVLLVAGFSYIYISQLLRQRISYAYKVADSLADSLVYDVYNAVPDLSSTRIDTSDPKALRSALRNYLPRDPILTSQLASATGNWWLVYDVALVDDEGRAIMHSNPEMAGKILPERPDLARLRDTGFRAQLRAIQQGPALYEVRKTLQVNGVPFATVRVGISTVFLRSEISPRLREAWALSLAATFLSLVLAATLSHVALSPLQRISERLDSMASGQPPETPEEEQPRDEYGLVTLKIAHLGRQMRDVKEVFSALKGNLDQIMANLEDGLMLFTQDSRLVLVSASAEQFLDQPRSRLLGKTAHEVFDDHTALGTLVLEAFRQRRSIAQHEVENLGRRVQVSLDFILEQGEHIGALLIMRDAESVRRIEDEIELSRRLAAIGRLTSGVAHEVKNPINAIVLHLENLRHKLPQLEPDARRHIDVIGSEIHRLDRVVQILVDFTRPVELRLEEMDLRRLLEEVVVLAQPEAERNGVRIERHIARQPLVVKIDVDLFKQALLNVVINGIQAMSQGGILTVLGQREPGEILAEVRDQGTGIPAELRDKIFTLYFTTKKGGSGIGLAMTYRVMQMHHGSIEFHSEPGQGTSFQLRLPAVESRADAARTPVVDRKVV